jgi:hypothetical protein
MKSRQAKFHEAALTMLEIVEEFLFGGADDAKPCECKGEQVELKGAGDPVLKKAPKKAAAKKEAVKKGEPVELDTQKSPGIEKRIGISPAEARAKGEKLLRAACKAGRSDRVKVSLKAVNATNFNTMDDDTLLRFYELMITDAELLANEEVAAVIEEVTQ